MIFDRIIDRFQLKFKDREAAGNILGESLENLINKKERTPLSWEFLEVE